MNLYLHLPSSLTHLLNFTLHSNNSIANSNPTKARQLLAGIKGIITVKIMAGSGLAGKSR